MTKKSNTFNNPIELTYSIGDMILLDTCVTGILAQVMPNTVCLILLQTNCNRLNNPVKLDDIHRISESEMKTICAPRDFTRIGRLHQ